MYFQNPLQDRMTQQIGREHAIHPKSRKLFNRALRAGKSGAGKHHMALPNIEEESRTAQHYRGAQTIALSEINGSVNKSNDFDYAFNPRSEHIEPRWVRVATAILNGIDLPPIELIYASGRYYVVDGHHRVSVAKQLGIRYLDAIVTEWE